MKISFVYSTHSDNAQTWLSSMPADRFSLMNPPKLRKQHNYFS